MNTNPKFWSDGFEIVDDSGFDNSLGETLGAPCVDETHRDNADRRLTPWQQLEARLGDRQLRCELNEWDYWDEYLAAH